MPSQLRPGDYVAGEYRVLKVFGGEGQSGMGVVYLVEHRTFYQPFVLKTYQASTLGDRKARFYKEAETWVQLGSHPNIVRCLWVNEIAGDLYVAAEYVAPDEDGVSTLGDRLRVGKIPLDKQLRWAAEFCFAMRHATKKGLVSHRDLKPANLMLDQGILKITDFGLSKRDGFVDQAALSRAPIAANITMEGTAIGTPPYMAPEQFVDSAKVNHRADIYSFGVVMYAMATGELPIYPERQPRHERELSILWARAHHYGKVRAAKFPLFPLVERCLRKNSARMAHEYANHLLAAQGKSLNGYVFLNKALERFSRHAGLWLCVAHILKDIPQYREQARTAAQNAMICLNEPPQQPPRVTIADVQPILDTLK
jgi:serine/threonine protein kinase